MREQFKRFEGSKYALIEVDLDASKNQEAYVWLLSVFIKFDAQNEALEGYEEFLETKEALIITLQHNERAFYVGSRMVDGWSELYFYSYDSKNLDAKIKNILAPSKYIYESSIIRDTKWDFYANELYPSELEFNHIQSAKIIEMLKEEGDELEVPREVEHYISFLTPTQKERFLSNFSLAGFEFKDEISSEEFENGVAFVKKHPVDEKSVREVVELLNTKIKKENGIYEGWSTVLVQKEQKDT